MLKLFLVRKNSFVLSIHLANYTTVYLTPTGVWHLKIMDDSLQFTEIKQEVIDVHHDITSDIILEDNQSSNLPTLLCPICQTIFYCRTLFLQHRKVHDREGQHPSSYQENYNFLNGQSANNESLSYNELKIEELEIKEENEKVQDGDEHVRVKRKRSRKDARVKCNICGKSYSDQQTLKRHQIIHTGERPFECDHCYATFNDKSTRNRHRKTHSALQPFQCKICNKTFQWKLGLVQHMRSHTGERSCKYEMLNIEQTRSRKDARVKCNICGITFSNQHNLKRHQTIHTGERSFECDQCYVAFNDESTLNSHLRTHSTLQAFHCKICNKTFRWKPSLIRHMRTRSHISMKCSILNKRIKMNIKRDERIENENCKYLDDRHDNCEHSIVERKHEEHDINEEDTEDQSEAKKSRLKVHQVIHTGERPFKCDSASELQNNLYKFEHLL